MMVYILSVEFEKLDIMPLSRPFPAPKRTMRIKSPHPIEKPVRAILILLLFIEVNTSAKISLMSNYNILLYNRSTLVSGDNAILEKDATIGLVGNVLFMGYDNHCLSILSIYITKHIHHLLCGF